MCQDDLLVKWSAINKKYCFGELPLVTCLLASCRVGDLPADPKLKWAKSSCVVVEYHAGRKKAVIFFFWSDKISCIYFSIKFNPIRVWDKNKIEPSNLRNGTNYLSLHFQTTSVIVKYKFINSGICKSAIFLKTGKETYLCIELLNKMVHCWNYLYLNIRRKKIQWKNNKKQREQLLSNLWFLQKIKIYVSSFCSVQTLSINTGSSELL